MTKASVKNTKRVKGKEKLTLDELVQAADAAKKVNPLDLSSDQDLSVALMNLISLEEHFFFSGAKTGKTGFYDMINTVRDMRKELMERIVQKSNADNGEVWCISKHLLAAAMRLMEVGTKALGAGNSADAYALFNKAYELYSLFWGINMNLIDLTGVKKSEPELYEVAMIDAATGTKSNEKKSQNQPAATPACPLKNASDASTVKRLGQWVKNAVNCCIE